MWKKDVKRIKREKDRAVKSKIESMYLIKKLIYKLKEEIEVEKKSSVKFEVSSRPSNFEDERENSDVGFLKKHYKLDSTLPLEKDCDLKKSQTFSNRKASIKIKLLNLLSKRLKIRE